LGISDIQLDELQTTLDAGGELPGRAACELIAEVRESRRILGLAANAVGLVSGEALRVAGRAEQLVERYREAALAADDGHATKTVDWPHGFEPPAADDA